MINLLDNKDFSTQTESKPSTLKGMSSFQFQSSEVLARLKPFGILFEKSLSDLIKGIRSHSKESPESLLVFLDNAIVECKDELNTTDLETKAMAILKLAYLEMYGFEMSWCNFHILEVMSSTKFQQKRVGYLAAIQSFKNEQDLLILATNQFKKDLNSYNHIEIGLALSGIATIVTPNLAKDINDDVLMKLNHTKPYIRKKAVLAMYKIFLQYPDSLRINFNRVIEKLDDPDNSVVSATINVICEISKKNPKIFINYVPKFFKILEETKNNWLIIRILKLFQSLSKVEPRMKKRILPTIVDLMLKTHASSLVYECISCIVNGSMLSPDSSKDKETAKLCIDQIMKFFETKDSNLKFVGLLALINIIKLYPNLIHKVKGIPAIIMECLTDNDLIIKRKALEVCHLLVSEDNIVELFKILLFQLIPNSDIVVPDNLKLEVTLKILSIASHDNYSNIPNFKWYVAVLKDMINLTLLPLKSQSSSSASISYSTATTISIEIGKEFKNLSTKIPSIRSIILNTVIIDMVSDINVLNNSPILLKDFYWILGEYVDELKVKHSAYDSDNESDDEEIENEDEKVKVLSLGKKIEILNILVNYHIDEILEVTNDKCNFEMSTKLLRLKEHDVQIVLIQTLVKLYSSIVNDYIANYSVEGNMSHMKFVELAYTLTKVIKFLSNWEIHFSYEVQERSLSWLEFLKLILEAMTEGNHTDIQKLQQEEVEHYRQAVREKILLESSGKEESSSDDESDEYSSSESEDEERDYIQFSSSDNEDGGDGNDDNEENYNKESEEIDSHVQENEINKEDKLSNGITESVEHQLPFLLTHILPSFFKSYPLNPIAKDGQKNIEIPETLDLDSQINTFSIELLSEDENLSDTSDTEETIDDDFKPFKDSPKDEKENLQLKKERFERLKDDPYYLSSTDDKKKKPKSKKLVIDEDQSNGNTDNMEPSTKSKKLKGKKLKKEKVVILSEETIGKSEDKQQDQDSSKPKKKKNLLKIDSSNLDNFDLISGISETGSGNEPYEYDVDLDELRNKLAESSVRDKDPMKKKKKKKDIGDNKSDDKTDKKKKSKKTKTNGSEEPSSAPNGAESLDAASKPIEELSNTNTESKDSENPNVIAIKKPKTKKKKAKAIIKD